MVLLLMTVLAGGRWLLRRLQGFWDQSDLGSIWNGVMIDERGLPWARVVRGSICTEHCLPSQAANFTLHVSKHFPNSQINSKPWNTNFCLVLIMIANFPFFIPHGNPSLLERMILPGGKSGQGCKHASTCPLEKVMSGSGEWAGLQGGLQACGFVPRSQGKGWGEILSCDQEQHRALKGSAQDAAPGECGGIYARHLSYAYIPGPPPTSCAVWTAN